MSAWVRSRHVRCQNVMSALPPIATGKADMCTARAFRPLASQNFVAVAGLYELINQTGAVEAIRVYRRLQRQCICLAETIPWALLERYRPCYVPLLLFSR